MAEYIEREAALNRLCQENCDQDYVKDKCQNCYVSAFIEYAPAADVVPVVHGRWINKTNHNRAVVEQRVDCSACGHIFWHTSAMSYNYCPNCGAHMKDGE